MSQRAAVPSEIGVVLSPLHAVTRPEVMERVLEVYADAFCGPPWDEGPDDVAAYRVRVTEDAQRPDAALAIASEGARVVGFATGWMTSVPFPDGGRSYWAIAEALTAQVVDRRLAGAFEVDELAVSAHAQRRGIGTRLLEALIPADRSAWLVTSRRATAALGLYRSLGWDELTGTASDGSTVVVFATPVRPASS